jgi:hypothetical protein
VAGAGGARAIVTRLTADARLVVGGEAGDDHGQAVAAAGEAMLRDVPEPLVVPLCGARTASEVASPLRLLLAMPPAPRTAHPLRARSSADYGGYLPKWRGIVGFTLYRRDRQCGHSQCRDAVVAGNGPFPVGSRRGPLLVVCQTLCLLSSVSRRCRTGCRALGKCTSTSGAAATS